jgi:hypothetical protein
MSDDNSVPVTVRYSDGSGGATDGPGWYVWESEYPEDGCVGFFKAKPTAEQLRELSPDYVER